MFLKNTIHLYERGGYPSIKQIEMIAKTYDVNPAWLVGWIEDEMMPGVQVVEKVVYKESQRQDCQIILTIITMVRLSSGSNHEDFEEVGFEEIERRRPQTLDRELSNFKTFNVQ